MITFPGLPLLRGGKGSPTFSGYSCGEQLVKTKGCVIGRRLIALCLVVSLVGACSRTGGDWPAPATGPSTVGLTTDQRRVVDELVNVFEYSSPAARYDSCTDLGDGRGFTCGKVGFTTSSTEVRDIVSSYVDEVPDSPLARYLPRLRQLADDGSNDTSGLSGFPKDWARAAGDAAFRAEQDRLADRLNYAPALAAARSIGLRTSLGVAILYDTAVQHGTSDDPDGLGALLASTREKSGGNPGDGVAEKTWLLAFLDVRADDLRDPHDADSRDVWAASVDRVDALRGLVEDDRPDLSPPVKITVDGDDYTLR
jgi:chitosanase